MPSSSKNHGRRFIRITVTECVESTGGSEGWYALAEPMDVRLLDGDLVVVEPDVTIPPFVQRFRNGEIVRDRPRVSVTEDDLWRWRHIDGR